MRNAHPRRPDPVVRRAVRELVGGAVAAARTTAADLHRGAWRDLIASLTPALHPYLEFKLAAADAIESIPADVACLLSRARSAAIVTDLQRRAVIRDVLACLAGKSIESILLKGAAVAHTVYPEPRLRPMTDVDIWVPASRVSDAARALMADGFEVPATGLAEGRLTPAIAQRRLRAIASGVLVELHGPVRSLDALSNAYVEGCWTRSVTARAAIGAARTLCPEDALVHTCLHLARTNRFANSQVGLLDLHLIVEQRGNSLDWDRLADVCRAERITSFVTVALSVACTVWGTRVPRAFLASAGNLKELGEMEALALEQVWTAHAPLPFALEQVFRQPTARARLGALVHRAFAHHWQRPKGEAAGGAVTLRQALDRVRSDITAKIPAYVRAWARGDLAGRELLRRVRLATKRGRIGVLAGYAEAALRRDGT